MRRVDVDMGVNREAIGYDERPRRRTELTGRELEVLRAVAGGMTAGQAAQALGVSTSTVVAALRRARARLGARSTAQALLLAERAGLLDEDGCE
jgi:DNA-binding CsgD family transcriptional regulator